jgi:hypothetical protein
MEYSITFYGRGHKNIVARHKGTIEFTKDSWLSRRGDCIILVGCDMAPSELPEQIKKAIRKNRVQIKFILHVEGLTEVIMGYGDPNLSLTDPRSMVIRKSGFTSPRTVAVYADKAAADIDRKLVALLMGGATASVDLIVKQF